MQSTCISRPFEHTCETAKMPSIYWIDLPLLDKRSNAIVDVAFPVILPHELFAGLVEGGDISNPTKSSSQLSQIHCDVARQLNIDPNILVAIGLHGDGVPQAKRKSIEVLSWNCLASGFATRYIFASVEKHYCCQCGCSGRHTIEQLHEAFAWSVRCMIEGKYPCNRHVQRFWGF